MEDRAEGKSLQWITHSHNVWSCKCRYVSSSLPSRAALDAEHCVYRTEGEKGAGLTEQ